MNTNDVLGMQSTSSHTAPNDRIAKGANIDTIIQSIAEFYGIGEVINYSEICVGYEDCNVIIQTVSNKYVAKLFARTRTAKDIDRYVEIMRLMTQAGVRHPGLIAGGNGECVLHEAGVWVVLADFIEGKTFYDMDRVPTADERRMVIAEVVKINALDHRPAHKESSWAASKFYTMLNRVRPYLSAHELAMVEDVAERYDQIPFDRFECALTHGDLRATNLLVTPDGALYVLDYFLANFSSKLQELAVMIASLLYDATGAMSLRQLCDVVADEY
ncbi:MAG: phosphotransferase, partial [Candidatus Saccharimonadales bacterium]